MLIWKKEKAVAGGQDMLSPYQAMGNNPVSSMGPGGSAYYSMENYVDNRVVLQIC